ncbi:portal protein [Xanthomonas sacchari]|uniref:portal protein n=1 Tax=Xanthomonas sacchari TaxID=56458 RepID=UPI00225A0A24|nr:portal protein [Xanthomonas sacchari]MCW0370260.1 hypothetical protein [Xanthomonas sacchari]
MATAQQVLKRHEVYKTQRTTQVEPTWRECFDFTFPLRGSGLSQAILTANAGTAAQARCLDATAADSAGILAANIMDGVTPANALWFALDAGNETDEERRWFDDAATLLWENIHMANFDAEGYECCLDIVCAGMFALFVDEDLEQGGFSFTQWPLASLYCGSTRPDGRIDIVHREYELNAEQAIAEFGADKVPEKIRKAVQDGCHGDMFKFIHAIYPRQASVVNARLAKNLPIASVHIEVESQTEVRVSGYHEMPVVVPRWLKVPCSVYAVGPVYSVLPSIRQLNTLKGLELASADIAVSGMWLAVDDGVLNARTIKLGARKIIVAADKDSLTPLTTGSNFELAEAMTAQLQNAIRKALMADQLPPADGPAKTAYEYSVRVEAIRKLLGPMYGRLQAEYLKPLIERCFGIAMRAGIFAPMPETLQDRSYSVKFVNPMARAQKLDEVAAIEATFQSAAAFAQFDPTILDELDSSAALRRIREARGAPGDIQRTPEEVKQLRDAKAQAQQQTQQQQGMQLAQQEGQVAAAKTAAVAA